MKSDEFFLSVLADHLAGRETAAPQEGLDWASVLTLADCHEVRGILYHQCKSFAPEAYRSRLAELYAMELFSYQNRIRLFSDVSAALQKEGIPFFTVKGLDVAALYPRPALRTMGDCDIVVKGADKERAHEVFLSLGYESRQKTGREWMYFKNGLEFELHHRLLYDVWWNSEAGTAFCERAWDYVREENGKLVLDWSFHYIFLLLHLRKHLVHGGVGLRQFMDLYVVAHGVELDRAWMKEELEKMGLRDFSDRCAELAESWFGGGEMTERSRRCLEQILRGGTFGAHDEANIKKQPSNRLLLAKGPRWLARLCSLTESVFPPYEDMRRVEYYRGLDGRPLLLPAFWIYRFYRAARYRMLDEGKRLLGDAMVSEREIEQQKEELELWGL